MRFLNVALVLLFALLGLASAFSHRRLNLEEALQALDVLAQEERLARALVAERRERRSSEKKSYPRNCYFSPIQCLFTRNT